MTAADNARRRRIEEIFEHAADAPEADRADVLERMCGDDAELRREVESLLAAHERAGGILEANAFDAASALVEECRDARIGPYRVLRRIGRGGMGIVYLAERDDGQFRRRVAIKVLSSGAEDIQLYRRFLAERQILASLDHPNIAHLLDGGMTEDGIPYLVMEHVEGRPITEYCDRNRLDVGQRLHLFRTACEAVHYAHQNLVIHRDIKPGHIFVGEDGVVKLLDFGIAKLLNPGLFPMPMPVTRTDHLVLTPEYASPEQLRGEAITTTTDVYSLGVVLYELLVGEHPYRLTRRSPEEIVRAVCDVDPDRPSTRLRAAGTAETSGRPKSVQTVSDARATTPERLRRRLRGDLDAIIMKALRKEPHRRYASAELLSADIRNYLEEQPVVANRGSGVYRLAKFARRNRMAAAAVVLVGASLTTGAGVAVWQASVAGRERDSAENARAETQTALDESRAVSDFLIGLFQASAPDETQGDTVTAAELLQRGIARADDLSDSPPVQARMLDVIGRVYEGLGEYAKAAATLERALAIRRSSAGPRSLDVAETLSHLGVVRVRQGDYVQAITLLEEALGIRRERLGAADTTTTNTMATLAGYLIYRGRVDESEALFREALQQQESVLGPDAPTVANTLIDFGAMLARRGRGDEAESMLRRALEIRENALGPDSPDVAGAMYGLADVLHNNGKPEEAVSLYRRGLAINRKVAGEHGTDFVSAMTRFADFMLGAGHTDEAEIAFRESIDVRSRLLGPHHPSIAEVRGSLAWTIFRAGRAAEADSVFRVSVPQLVEAYGPDHPKVAQAELNWAKTRSSLGDHDGAARLADDALRIRRLAGGGETTLVGLTYAEIARLRDARGDYAGADSLFRRSIVVMLRTYPPDHYDVRRVHADAAEFYARWGRPAEAALHRGASQAGSGR